MAGISKVKGSGLATGAATESLVGIDDNATSTAITIGADETVGISVAPETWHNSYQALQVGGRAALAYDGQTTLTHNVYASTATGAPQYYIDSSVRPSMVRLTNTGTIDFSVASSGTADTTIPFNTAMTIANSGKVGIGTSSPSAKAHVTSSSDQLTISEGSSLGATFDYQSSTGALNIGTNGSSARTSPSISVRPAYLGGGITFNGDTAAANALDDYETGTWTPVLIGASDPVYASTTAGTYTKTGNTVTLSGVLTLTSITQNNGQVRIGGFPFTVDNSTNAGYTPAVVFPETAISYFNDGVVGLAIVNTTYMAVYSPRSTTGTSTANTTYAHIGDNARFRISVTFRVK